jgi:hypothetical protein
MKFTIDKGLSMHSHFRFGQIRTNKNTKHSNKGLKEQACNDLTAKILSLFIKNNKNK